MTLDEIFQTYVDMEPEELVISAKKFSEPVLEYLEKGFNDTGKTTATYLAIIGTFLGIDGSVDKAEYAFCKAVFGFPGTFDEFFEIVKASCTAEMINAIDDMIDNAPIKVQTAFAMLGMSFCACNGTMTVEEQKLIKKYLD